MTRHNGAAQAVDLLALIGADTPLQYIAGTRGGEYHGPCPLCGGRDRFIVQPHADKPAWWCRRCGKGGDAIQYVRERDGLGFIAAKEKVTGGSAAPPRPPATAVSDQPDAGWRDQAE